MNKEKSPPSIPCYTIHFNKEMDNFSLWQEEESVNLQFNFGDGHVLKLHVKEHKLEIIQALLPLLNMSISKIELT